jgi:hypothetical protein
MVVYVFQQRIQQETQRQPVFHSDAHPVGL